MHAFYDYVADDEGAFRLVFESDLTNEPAVRARVDRVTTECAKLIAHVIADDTGLPEEQSQLLAVSLVGMGQVSARFWLGRARQHRPGRAPPPWSPGWPGAASVATPAPTRAAEPSRSAVWHSSARATPESTRRSSPWRSRSACRTSPAS